MRKIVYYVATSVDGYIAGPNEDITGYISEGSGLNKYLDDLKDFDTVIMGRKTYEFGYKFGLKPGQPAYSHMQHYIFSNTLQFDNPVDCVEIRRPSLENIEDIQKSPGTDIYLCGGGVFAGWLLEKEKIDILKIKLSPSIFGGGIPIFGTSSKQISMKLLAHEQHDFGLQIITYRILYNGLE